MQVALLVVSVIRRVKFIRLWPMVTPRYLTSSDQGIGRLSVRRRGGLLMSLEFAKIQRSWKG